MVTFFGKTETALQIIILYKNKKNVQKQLDITPKSDLSLIWYHFPIQILYIFVWNFIPIQGINPNIIRLTLVLARVCRREEAWTDNPALI